MKRIAFILGLLLVGLLQAQGQVPQMFSYQAVLRNADGTVLANQTVDIKVSLFKTDATGLLVYSEVHSATTSGQGVVTLSIGKDGGEVTGTFSAIPWGEKIFLQVEVKKAGGSYQNMGTSQILSVPYTLQAGYTLLADSARKAGHATQANRSDLADYATQAGYSILADSARKAGHATQANRSDLSDYATLAGNVKVVTSTTADDAIFEVKNKDGKVVFGVYQGGVRIYVDDTGKKAKGARAGFAVGGITNSGKTGDTVEYFRITPDSARINVNEPIAPAKGARGGFAVGGITNSGKSGPYDLLFVDPDYTRVYFNESPAKGARGGFAVGGITNSGKKAISGERLYVDSDSTRFYVKDDPTGGSGGFAVTGLPGTASANTNYFKITNDTTYFSTTLSTTGDILTTGNVNTGAGTASEPITDIDGNIYQTVKIGNQIWMKENLKTTRCSYGKPIGKPVIATNLFVYNNSTTGDTLKNFGMLYSKTIIMDTTNVCPIGWHVPTTLDWDTLLISVGGYNWLNDKITTGLKLMEKGTTLSGTGFWNKDNNANNASGFSGRPGGKYDANEGGFTGISTAANWWKSEGFSFITLDGTTGAVMEGSVPTSPPPAYSVRCVKGKAIALPIK